MLKKNLCFVMIAMILLLAIGCSAPETEQDKVDYCINYVLTGRTDDQSTLFECMKECLMYDDFGTYALASDVKVKAATGIEYEEYVYVKIFTRYLLICLRNDDMESLESVFNHGYTRVSSEDGKLLMASEFVDFILMNDVNEISSENLNRVTEILDENCPHLDRPLSLNANDKLFEIVANYSMQAACFYGVGNMDRYNSINIIIEEIYNTLQ